MKRNYQHRKKTKSYSKNNTSPWVWLLVGLIIGITIPVFMHIANTHKNKPVVPPSVKLAKSIKPVKKATHNYDFYTMLEKQDENESAPITQELTEEKPIPTPKLETYSLQVAAFKSTSEADKLRAELIIQGYNVFLSKIDQGDNTFIRVNIGPFKSLKEAQKVQHQLAENSIKAIVNKP